MSDLYLSGGRAGLGGTGDITLPGAEAHVMWRRVCKGVDLENQGCKAELGKRESEVDDVMGLVCVLRVRRASGCQS